MVRRLQMIQIVQTDEKFLVDEKGHGIDYCRNSNIHGLPIQSSDNKQIVCNISN